MNRKYAKLLVAASAAAITFIVYLTSLRNGFVRWDDDKYVYENPFLKALDLDFIKWAFSTFVAGNWHPLTWMSYSVDYTIWGMNPLGYHLTNNVLHAINTCMAVFLVTMLMEALKKTTLPAEQAEFLNERTILISGAVTGFLFGLHPLHVESAAWISERKDLLCGLFFLVSIIVYVKYADGLKKTDGKTGEAARNSFFLNKLYLLSLGLFVLALMSKPMAVSLPVVLLILDWYPFRRITSFRTFRIAFVEKLPFLALSLISSILTFLVQKGAGAVAPEHAIPLSTRLLIGAKALIAYLWKMLLPLDLIPFYSYPPNASLSSLEYLGPVIAVLGITTLCVVFVRSWRLASAAWGYYVLTLIPVLGIVQVGEQSMADRYTYLPSLGPFLIAGLISARAWSSANTVLNRALIVKLLGAAAVIFFFASMSYLTIKQIAVWRNSIGFWNYVIEKGAPTSFVPYYHRGFVYGEQGQYDRAIADYTRAIELNPYDLKLYNNRGTVYQKKGHLDEAIADYSAVIALKPEFETAYQNRANAYLARGRYDSAIADYDKVIELNPNALRAYNNRGYAYVLIRRFDRGLEDFSKAIELDHLYAAAYVNRGGLHLSRGDKGSARADFLKACNLGNDDGCKALNRLDS